MSELKALKHIYLQNYFEDFGFYDEGVTWCEDKQNDEDIEYILQSEYDQLRAENERLREALREIAKTSSKYKVERGDDDNNNYWEWEDNGLDVLLEIDSIVEQALKGGE